MLEGHGIYRFFSKYMAVMQPRNLTECKQPVSVARKLIITWVKKTKIRTCMKTNKKQIYVNEHTVTHAGIKT